MRFPSPLVAGRLIKRYKRFLADVVLDSGEEVTIACPNTGAMLGLTAAGSKVWMSISTSPTRKYRHTWEMIEADLGTGPTLVGINPLNPNRIVGEAIADSAIAELAGYSALRREVKYGRESRIDFLLEDDARGLCYVEVKNVHLMRAAGQAEFPDSVTTRGARHLRELSDMVAAGHRAVMLYLIQRADARTFSLAEDCDPAYAAAFRIAKAAGVEMVAYRCALSPDAITLTEPVPVLS
jgi:sugar fermentation stimulation protein A